MNDNDVESYFIFTLNSWFVETFPFGQTPHQSCCPTHIQSCPTHIFTALSVIDSGQCTILFSSYFPLSFVLF